jgi:ribosomal protein S18 acetylase RimI-like enzyme
VDYLRKYNIRELTPDLLGDYLSFFEQTAFVDHPEWEFCFCRLHHFPHDQREWKKTTARENREAVISLIRDGTMRGYLAYSGAKPVGWCNAGPRVHMTTVPEYDEPEADQIGSIMCFVVAKEHRRQGVASQLLGAACNGFTAHGLTIAEGYPLKEALGEAENHCGPLSLYLSAGFERYWEDDDVVVVRKRLV